MHRDEGPVSMNCALARSQTEQKEKGGTKADSLLLNFSHKPRSGTASCLLLRAVYCFRQASRQDTVFKAP